MLQLGKAVRAVRFVSDQIGQPLTLNVECEAVMWDIYEIKLMR